MKKALLPTLLLLLLSTITRAGDFIKELENSMNRKDAKVIYHLYYGNGQERTLNGFDFTSGEIVKRGDIPYFVQLYKGSGDEKQNIMINLVNAVYYHLSIKKVMGVWEYDFHFYY